LSAVGTSLTVKWVFKVCQYADNESYKEHRGAISRNIISDTGQCSEQHRIICQLSPQTLKSIY